MPCEIPTLKMCCFCIPLRRGLLGYAYLKLAITLLLLMLCMYTNKFDDITTYTRYDIRTIFALVVVAYDISMTVAFVVGGHMKNPRLLKVYMWYIIVSAALSVLLTIAVIIHAVYVVFIKERVHRDSEAAFVLHHILQVFYMTLFTTLTVVLQLYLVSLIRSETLKLESKGDAVHYQIGDDKTNITFEGTPKLQSIKYI